VARRAWGSAGEAAALATEVDGRGHEKNATKKEAAGRRLGAGKRRGNFLERAGSLVPARDTAMRSRVRARKDARADGRNAKLLKMPTLFPKLLETGPVPRI